MFIQVKYTDNNLLKFIKKLIEGYINVHFENDNNEPYEAEHYICFKPRPYI